MTLRLLEDSGSNSMILAASLSDQEGANVLIRRVLDSLSTTDVTNREFAIAQFGFAQASIGRIREAKNTVAMIAYSTDRREQLKDAIVEAQIKAGDVAGALRTALSMEGWSQDGDLVAIIDCAIQKRDVYRALAASKSIDRPSLRASALLKIATFHARSGKKKAAMDLASQIQLIPLTFPHSHRSHFDFRSSRTWGVCYDWGGIGTISSYLTSVERAATVAFEAMTLAQTLGQPQTEPYSVSFADLDKEIIRALARAHAASGDANKALTWARQIGNSDIDNPTRIIEKRIYALLGVAEGILDAKGEMPLVPAR